MAADGGVFRGDAFAHTPISCTFSDFLSHGLAAADSSSGSSARASPSQGTASAGEGKGASRGLAGADRGADRQQAPSQQPSMPERRPHVGSPQAAPSGLAGTNGTLGKQSAEGQHLYLAQAAIKSSAPGPCGLAPLQEDIRLPACLTSLPVDHINLWMSIECACHPSQCPPTFPRCRLTVNMSAHTTRGSHVA